MQRAEPEYAVVNVTVETLSLVCSIEKGRIVCATPPIVTKQSRTTRLPRLWLTTQVVDGVTCLKLYEFSLAMINLPI
jgi:hypothetical protein